MLYEALLTGRAGMCSVAKHHSHRAKRELNRLFQCADSRRELTRSLRILPNYFSHELVEQFCDSPLYASYSAGELQFQPSSGGSSSVERAFTTHRLQRTVRSQESLRILEVYLHWLMNHCGSFDLHENNYAMEMLNLEQPEKWFQIKDLVKHRTFIYHHGPTNSGKSTAAIAQLKALKGNERGIYMAPLRLLAWEYQQKLENCSLITGQEKDFKNLNMISCTIEAAPLNEEYDVAVIDEIQMIGDEERGWAWTKAVLGIKAKRIHLCGDERALGIVSKLLEKTDDILQQRRYSRLSKLTLIHKSFRLDKIAPGDCIINFSMKSLINHRNDINKHINSRREGKKPADQLEIIDEKTAIISQGNEKVKTNHAAIVYGRLPPECRKSQALMFNSRQLPYLVATNAIGMGLNLNIRKVIFLTIDRQTSTGTVELEQHEIQQIAGRAGRGKETGYVQCVNESVLKRVQQALSKVNETYGIQLENIKDDGNETLQPTPDDVQQEDRSEQIYSPLLGRYLKEKESRIKTAGFYFQTDYVIICKLELQALFGKPFTTKETVNYLRNYANLGNLYSLQSVKDMDYIFGLLQDRNLDQAELFMLYNGFGLSVPNHNMHKAVRNVIQKAHIQYIDQFVKFRKVDLPSLIVKLYNQNFESYRYMDQLAQLQFYFNLIETYVWLWGKFEFVFHQIKLAINIKLALSEKINELLINNQFLRDRQGQNEKRNSFVEAARQASSFHRKPHHHSHKKQYKQKDEKERKQEQSEKQKKEQKSIFSFLKKKMPKQEKRIDKTSSDIKKHSKEAAGFFNKFALIEQQQTGKLKRTKSKQKDHGDQTLKSRNKKQNLIQGSTISKVIIKNSKNDSQDAEKEKGFLRLGHRTKERKSKDTKV